MRLDHIGIAVHEIEDALRTFETLLDTRRYKMERVDSEGVVTHFLSVNGVKIELLESTDPSSAVSTFLEKRGDGVHHLAFNVANLDRTRIKMQELGYRIVGPASKPGADGKSIFFLHPKDVFGVLIECCSNDSLSAVEVVDIQQDIAIRTFGSHQNPAVIIAVSESINLFAVDDLVRVLEPTFFIVLVEGLRDRTKTIELQKCLREILPGPSANGLTIGSAAGKAIGSIPEDIVTIDGWAHIDLASQDLPERLKSESLNASCLFIRIGRCTGNPSGPSVNLPDYAICPANPESDALTPLLRSFWNTGFKT